VKEKALVSVAAKDVLGERQAFLVVLIRHAVEEFAFAALYSHKYNSPIKLQISNVEMLKRAKGRT